MALQCEHCQKTFPTNASLYKHKQREHNKSSLVIVNHSHKKMDGGIPPNPRTRSYIDDDPSTPRQPSKKSRIDGGPKNNRRNPPPRDPQYDDDLAIVDKYTDPGEKPRDFEPRKPPKYNSQSDDELQVIDEYKRDDEDDEDDDQLTIIDSYEDDGQSDDNLTIIDEFDDGDKSRIKSSVDYKKKYLECLKAHKNQRAKFLKKIAKSNNQHKNNLSRVRKERDKCQEEISKIKHFHRRQMTDLETLLEGQYDDKLQDLKRAHDKLINDMKIAHRKGLDDTEKECQRKLDILNNQIKAMQEDDEDLSSLSKAIFNCTTMEEIFEIQRLIKNYQLDIVVQNHLPTLQNLFLSLSYGILPICQPQREKVTDDQRRVVERIQTASRQTAKNILRNKRSEIVKLFSIIEDSIKLARDTYQRYGTSL